MEGAKKTYIHILRCVYVFLAPLAYSHPIYNGDSWHRGSNMKSVLPGDDLTLHIYANFKASETFI